MTVRTERGSRPTSSLFSDVVRHVTALVRGEVALAKAEMAENARHVISGVLMIAGAAVLAVVGLSQLADAAVAALVSMGLSFVWAAVTVGGTAVLFAALLVHEGLGAFERTNLIPRRTVRNVRRDAEQIKETFNDPSR
ncbi:phage holin family protein [Albidovulum sp.]|uniref:phage holin family protein n=1 Tax=Albidovulum sp. TaxID=1872424 RepID=UPI0025C0CE06|nr:phage holin family protein [Defluviimonas sp.]